jgi:hypothetical protein
MRKRKSLSGLYEESYKDTFNELAEVVRVVEVVVKRGEHYRLEVLLAHDERQRCSVRCWVLRDVTLQPTYPQEGQTRPVPESMQLFVLDPMFPRIDDVKPENAMRSALRWLAQRQSTASSS